MTSQKVTQVICCASGKYSCLSPVSYIKFTNIINMLGNLDNNLHCMATLLVVQGALDSVQYLVPHHLQGAPVHI